MKIQSISKACAVSVLGLCVLAAPMADAMSPDSGAPANPTLGRGSMKEIFEWRAAVGWGLVGGTNTFLTYASGASRGEITKAALGAICGTGAAGVFANWKPDVSPTAMGNMRAAVKGGAIVATSNVCAWMTQTTLTAINFYSPAADRFFNNAKYSIKTAVDDQVKNAQIELSVMRSSYMAAATLRDDIASEEKILYDNNCGTPLGYVAYCNSVETNLTRYKNELTQALSKLNSNGNALHNSLQNIGKLVNI